MDELYFLDGYYEGNYFVYTADVIVGFTPYIAEGYLDQGFFEDRGGAFTLTGSLTRQAFQEFAAAFTGQFTFVGVGGRRQLASASLTSAFTHTATIIKTARVQPSLTSSVSVATVSVKTARSSVALTTIANLSAQAARTRALTSSINAAATATTIATKTTQTALALSSVFTTSSTAQRTRTTVQSFVSTATQTTATIKTAHANIALTSAFAPVIVANASVSNGAGLTASFTLSVLTGVRRQFPGNSLTGAATSVSPGYYPQVLDFDQTQFPSVGDFQIRDPNWTFGVWIKRESRTNYFETIATSTVDVGGTNNKAAIAFRGSNIRFRFNFDPDEPGATWYDVAPNDTDWHHYLFRSIVNPANDTYPVQNWRLWVDGVYQGVTDDAFQATGDLTWCGKFNTNPGDPQGSLVLGYQDLARDSAGYDFNPAPFNGAFAQAWMGRVTDAQFDVNRFYNGGPIDLGATGVSTSLPTPIFYNKLTSAYTGVTWTNSGGPLAATAPLTLPSLQARFTLTCSVVTVIQEAAALQSQFAVSVSGTRVLVLAATLAASSTQSLTAQKTARATETLTSTATLSASAEKLRGVGAGLTATATLTATAFKVKQFESAVAAAATLSAQVARTRGISKTLSVAATFTATIDDRTRDAITLQAGAFALNITYTRVRYAASAISSSTAVTTTAVTIKRTASTVSSQFTQVVVADVVKIVIANFTSQFAITSIVFRAVIGQAALSANGFVLTQGDILNFDPCREIKVDPETRWAKILPENRLLIVESETRTLKVAQETRVLRVDYETRVNIIKC